MRQTLWAVLILASSLALPLESQQAGAGHSGKRRLLPRAEEIALARSAGPASVADSARILVFTDSGFVTAQAGTTGVTCLVNRSWPDALEPECFDAEAALTIMPMELRRTELYHQGVANPEVDRDISSGLADGRYRLPARPAVVYMMSAGQQLIGDDGKPAGHWRPHLMIYYPFLTSDAVGHHGESDLSGGLVVDSGKPTANLMVVVPAFVPVRKTSGGSR